MEKNNFLPFLLIFLFVFIYFSVPSYAWLSNWNYRMPILISSIIEINDYQILIQLNTQTLISQGKMRSDCGDIRITDLNDNLLNYWIEDGTCNSQNTRIWVKVPKINFGETRIYLYYGNPSATSLSNGDSVFEFFDDFSGSSLNTNKWDVVAGSQYSVSNGKLNIRNTDVKILSKTSFSAPAILEIKNIMYSEAYNDGYTEGGFYAST
ncbi:MAG: DUF2341 domain-containing protein, partial [Candidatus Aenigmarchaeota archaeon]|nr:DUF2341 domain-containing protein [Candidatus Aenigmarchaeota archaeon]